MGTREGNDYCTDDGWIPPADRRYREDLEHKLSLSIHADPNSEWAGCLSGLWSAPFAERRRFAKDAISAVVEGLSAELPCFFRDVFIPEVPNERGRPTVTLKLQAAPTAIQALPDLLGRFVPIEMGALRAAQVPARPAVDVLMARPVTHDAGMTFGAAACRVSDQYCPHFGGVVTIREDERGLTVRVTSSPPFPPWTGETLEKVVQMWAVIASRVPALRSKLRTVRLFVAEGDLVGQEIHEVWNV